MKKLFLMILAAGLTSCARCESTVRPHPGQPGIHAPRQAFGDERPGDSPRDAWEQDRASGIPFVLVDF